MSRGLPTPMQLPSESDVSSSCRDSAEFTLPDFTKDGEITGRRKNLWVTLPYGAYSQNNSVLDKRAERMIVMHKTWSARWKTFDNRSIVCRNIHAAGGLWMISDSVYPPELSERRLGFFLAFIFAFFIRMSLKKFNTRENADLPLCDVGESMILAAQTHCTSSCLLTCKTVPVLLLAWSWNPDQKSHPHTYWGLGQQDMEWWSSSAWLVSMKKKKEKMLRLWKKLFCLFFH